MGVGAGLYMYVVVVQKFTFAISSPDEFLLCMQCAAKAIEFAEIAQTNDHYAVQGHSRSPILLPIESSSRTSYK